VARNVINLTNMELHVQSAKKQKCFMINPETGVREMSPEFTAQEQESFSISHLDLWNQSDTDPNKYDKNVVIDSNHAKLLGYKGFSTAAVGTAKGTIEAAADDTKTATKQDTVRKALQAATKAAAELSILVQLTTLVQSNRIFSLQTFRNQQPKKGPENQKEVVSISESWNLPVPQRVEMQRARMHKAAEKLLAGLRSCRERVHRRQEFASTLLHCQSERFFDLCCVDRKSGKRIRHRKYESKKDYLALDCSVRIASYPPEASATTPLPQKRAAGLSSAASVVSADSSAHGGFATTGAFIPILLGANGVEVSTDERERIARTLQLRVLTVSGNGGAGSIAVVTVCAVAAWELLGAQQAESGNTEAAVEELLSQCKRRKHETLCRAVFERLQRESIANASRWEMLSAITTAEASDLPASGAVSALKQALREERLTRGVVVARSDADTVVLQVSDSLWLELSLVPISGAATASGDAMEVQDNPAGHSPLAAIGARFRSVLSKALLNVFVRLLKGPSSDDLDAVEEVSAAEGEDYWSSIAKRQEAHRREAEGANMSEVKQLLDAVRLNIQQAR
jgi:hypothetical protein